MSRIYALCLEFRYVDRFHYNHLFINCLLYSFSVRRRKMFLNNIMSYHVVLCRRQPLKKEPYTPSIKSELVQLGHHPVYTRTSRSVHYYTRDVRSSHVCRTYNEYCCPVSSTGVNFRALLHFPESLFFHTAHALKLRKQSPMPAAAHYAMKPA